jgi:CPA2 family monovalent cation:H+ antiporter-2
LEVAATAGLTVAKVAAFVAVMLVIGKRAIPWLLHYMAHTGSRELFRLSVFVIALGAAYAAAEIFGVSFALGAFFAGMIMAESALSEQAARETIPLRDAFAVIFFVSVGMLFAPAILVDAPLAVLATVLIIILGKSLAAFLIIRAFGYSNPTAMLVSVSLAQIGEFSFILAGLGVGIGVLPEEGRSLILAGALLSILFNPLLFAGLDLLSARREKAKPAAEPAKAAPGEGAREPLTPTSLSNHVGLVGHGRVGSEVARAIAETGTPLLVISGLEDVVSTLKDKGIDVIVGNGADPAVTEAANLKAACCLLVAIPDAFEGGQVVEQARTANPDLRIVARAHSDEEVEHLEKHGATSVIMGESEIAKAMIKDVKEAVSRSGHRSGSDRKPALSEIAAEESTETCRGREAATRGTDLPKVRSLATAGTGRWLKTSIAGATSLRSALFWARP